MCQLRIMDGLVGVKRGSFSKPDRCILSDNQYIPEYLWIHQPRNSFHYLFLQVFWLDLLLSRNRISTIFCIFWITAIPIALFSSRSSLLVASSATILIEIMAPISRMLRLDMISARRPKLNLFNLSSCQVEAPKDDYRSYKEIRHCTKGEKWAKRDGKPEITS